MDILRLPRDAHVAVDGAALLREAGHIDHADALAFEVRGHAEHAADRDDAGAADPRNDDVVGAVDRRQGRLGKRRNGLIGRAPRARIAFELRPVHGDEGRAKTLEAGKILVAARLVDRALAPELGLQRLHRDAVRHDATVAAAFADKLIDDDALVRIRISAALAPPAFLGRAGLVIDQDGAARCLCELDLHLVELVAVMDGQAGRPPGIRWIFFRLVRHHEHALDAFGRNLARDLRHGKAAVVRLAAGHGHGVIEQDFVGDVDARRDRRPDRQIARVIVGAVAEILEYVAAFRERRLADPIRALGAHLGEARGAPVHPLHHVVAADACIGAHAVGDHRRSVVGTAGAEIGRALRDVVDFGECALRLFQPRHLGGDQIVVTARKNALADADRDVIGIERALDREQPIALLVLLADTGRLVGGAVEFLAHLHFE